MNNKNIEKAIETICYSGCTSVNNIIAALENGKTIDQSKDLSKEEIEILIKELKAIMAVYENQ